MPLFVVIFKYTFWEAFLNVLYFPVWWYTIGVKKRTLDFIRGVATIFHNLAIKLMITHLFKPMFGERSWQGRLISFFMRLILLIWRFFCFLIGSLLRFFILVVWIILPIFSFWQIFRLIGFN